MLKNRTSNSREEREGRAEKAIQSDGPDPSAAPPLLPPGRSPWLWPAPRTSPPPRCCSAPEAPPPSSPTPFAPYEPSPPPGTRLSVWQQRKRNWQPGADGKIITLFSPRSRGETCDCVESLNVIWIFFFYYVVWNTVWEHQIEKPASEEGKVDGIFDKGRKWVSVGSPGLQLAESGLKLLKPSISSFLSAHSFGYVFLLDNWKFRHNIFVQRLK